MAVALDRELAPALALPLASLARADRQKARPPGSGRWRRWAIGRRAAEAQGRQHQVGGARLAQPDFDRPLIGRHR